MKKERKVLIPLLAAALVAVGMLVGFYLPRAQDDRETLYFALQKFQETLQFVKTYYVDNVSPKKLVDDAITGMLGELDPHSVYIPAENLQKMDEPLQGSFEGIGIEFNIIEDTIYVVAPISGGPSEQLGIMSGDRIVEIEGKNVAGVGFKTEDVLKSLRGPKGTKVNVKILRRGRKELIPFTITRDKIPLFSVDAGYMLDVKTGYIKVSRFAKNTYEEFKTKLTDLKKQGLENLIVDLRGNPGGYLETAYKLADEFIGEAKMIVFTKGRTDKQADYVATSGGGFEKGALIVLVDEGSASASEILSGAVQDWDRGIVIGRRTFGKGLVQKEWKLSDGSAIRLTVSRYYTPTGRLIQRPYKEGKEKYYEEFEKRFESKEIYKVNGGWDSVTSKIPDSLKFKTPTGRVVYGGGGIMPDYYVPADTNGFSEYYESLFRNGVFNNFAIKYVEQHPEVKNYPSVKEFDKSFSISEQVKNDFIKFAESAGVKFSEKQYQKSELWINNFIKAQIARNIWKTDGYFFILGKTDITLQKALEMIPEAQNLTK